MIEQRTAARKRRDFAESDRIRDYLLEKGIQLEDTRDGTRWKRLR
jgi:cysteinyl-tRNA synthetase